jgi:ketosteroid isomerase-like protein
MRAHNILMAVTILLGSRAVSQVPPSTSNATQVSAVVRESREVTAAAEAIIAAFGRHDPKGYFALFAPEASFVFYTTPRRLNSRAEYESEWVRWEKEDAFRIHSCKSAEQLVQIFGNVAVFTHTVHTELSTTEGPSTFRERETIVFERRRGKWVAVHEHLSPHPEPQPSDKK